MPRTARASAANPCYHMLNRGRNAPFGTDPWVLKTATTLGLESALRARGNSQLTGDRASDA
jgi:hypothetical protein